MQSKAKTVKEYIDSLSDDRKSAITDIRKVILKNLPKGFEETMQYGMISYVVPHKTYPSGYHASPKDALPFISLASQKNYLALYHMMVYQGELHDWFVRAWKNASDKKLDMGKVCIRFKKQEDVPLKLLGELVSKVTPEQWIEVYEKTIRK
jgi:hypothetical protein